MLVNSVNNVRVKNLSTLLKSGHIMKQTADFFFIQANYIQANYIPDLTVFYIYQCNTDI